MQLTSPAFEEGQYIPAKYTCEGEDVNPPLIINEVPTKTKSLILMVDDPDAPLGHWIHWLIWNIDPSTAEIAENSSPLGAQMGLNDFGTTKWSGPCPPSGVHRYFFKLFALDCLLNLPATTPAKKINSAIQGHTLAQAMLSALFTRSK